MYSEFRQNKGNPNAATEFAQLEQAYRVLTDLQARGALDDLLRAKMQRQARRSSENDLKRKMRDELEQREKQAQEPLAAAITCTVKVSWDASSRQYTADELRRIFSAHGSVQDVVVRESRRKNSKSSNCPTK
ncbi:molecular chaperone [Haematococcus lacustris]|uniref:Molecular chaperone n=1 Tax=Haematococcus lacustris TaxID=44745 RepID=A0A699ZPZ7_HAELA|nr:molecular chaperone [Haematococcus lacustris]